jgi:gag-polypeptide of LTR copia-type
MSEEYTSGNYQMEMLKATNWMPWKQRMLVVLQDLGLKKYIAADAKISESANRSKPTADELEAQRKWCEGDTKACTQIELAISDAEMIHISGAMTAQEMWSQLSLVKKSKGRLGVLATHRALYKATAEEGFDMINHISYGNYRRNYI